MEPRLLCLQELIRNLGSQDGSPLLQIGSVRTVNKDSVGQSLAKDSSSYSELGTYISVLGEVDLERLGIVFETQ